MKVAATQFSLRSLKKTSDFWLRVNKICKQAKDKKVDAILFPEYFSLSLVLQNAGNSFQEKILNSKKIEEEFISEFRQISDRLDLLVIAGSIPHLEETKILNRSWIFIPGESPLSQDKIHMTRFESEEWKISPGKPELKLFRHAGALCAVAICYDVEFPAYCAVAAEKKVDVLFVPSCTEDIHGYWRVRHCAEARAVENQSFVVLSSIVDGNSNFPEISAHYGMSAILSPCDIGFPDGGILSEGAKKEGFCVAELDLGAIQRIRKNGTVLNLLDSSNKKAIEGVY
jgi:predicted amidohydrolase